MSTTTMTEPKVLRPAPDDGPEATTLWALEEDLWPVVLRAPGETIEGRTAIGKEPLRPRFGADRPTAGSLRHDFAGHPGRGAGLRVGPSGGWGDIEGDGPAWKEQIDDLCRGEDLDVLGFDSKRGGHNMVLPPPPELADIPNGAKFPWSEFSDLEIRLNGKDVQGQSVIPPTATDDFPRCWRGPWRIAPLPDAAVETLAKLWEEDQRRRQAANQQAYRSRTKRKKDVGSGPSPIDQFNADTGVEGILAMLEAHGWRFVKHSGDVLYVAHPDATGPWSGSIGWCGDRLYCWSPNTDFPAQKPQDAFDVFRVLEHGGDFGRALREIRDRGFGRSSRAQASKPGPGPEPSSNGDGRHPEESESEATEPEPLALTDMGNAERFARDHSGQVRHVGTWKRWLVFTGPRWELDETGAIVRRAKRTVRGIAAEAALAEDSERFKAIAGWARKSEDAKRVQSMIGLAASDERIAITHRELNADPWLLNVQNGTLDLKAGELLPHDPGRLITHMAPVDFDPDATCPLWESTLRLVFAEDAPLMAFWQRLCGYWMTGAVREQVLPIAYGGGSNGKSTVLGTMLHILGTDYAYEADPSLIMQRSRYEHPTEKASLFGKRMVSFTETDSGGRLNEETVKRLTGKEQITARRMREDPWSFWPTHKLVLATNHRPEIRGTDYAIWRRVLLVPFEVTIPKDKEITDFAERLKAEAPGILAWAVRGCLAWQERGLDPPERVQVATEQYRKSQDDLGSFIEERCTIHREFKIRSGELYQAYCGWAKNYGYDVIGSRTFYDAITARGFPSQVGSKNRRFVQGLTLRPENGDSDGG